VDAAVVADSSGSGTPKLAFVARVAVLIVSVRGWPEKYEVREAVVLCNLPRQFLLTKGTPALVGESTKSVGNPQVPLQRVLLRRPLIPGEGEAAIRLGTLEGTQDWEDKMDDVPDAIDVSRRKIHHRLAAGVTGNAHTRGRWRRSRRGLVSSSTSWGVLVGWSGDRREGTEHQGASRAGVKSQKR
jgi:hypothetical protein